MFLLSVTFSVADLDKQKENKTGTCGFETTERRFQIAALAEK